MKIEEIGALVVDTAMKVHSVLGPGLLDTAPDYRAARRPAYGLAPVLNSIESGVPVSLNASRK